MARGYVCDLCGEPFARGEECPACGSASFHPEVEEVEEDPALLALDDEEEKVEDIPEDVDREIRKMKTSADDEGEEAADDDIEDEGEEGILEEADVNE